MKRLMEGLMKRRYSEIISKQFLIRRAQRRNNFLFVNKKLN